MNDSKFDRSIQFDIFEFIQEIQKDCDPYTIAYMLRVIFFIEENNSNEETIQNPKRKKQK